MGAGRGISSEREGGGEMGGGREEEIKGRGKGEGRGEREGRERGRERGEEGIERERVKGCLRKRGVATCSCLLHSG